MPAPYRGDRSKSTEILTKADGYPLDEVNSNFTFGLLTSNEKYTLRHELRNQRQNGDLRA